MGTLGCLVPQGSRDSLVGLARQSMARMETEGLQGLQERQADLAYQAPWGCQASVNLQPALEHQPIPLPASQSLDPLKDHEQQARTGPARILGPLQVDILLPQGASFPGPLVEVLRTRSQKHRGREGKALRVKR